MLCREEVSRTTERYKAGLRQNLENVFMQLLPAGSRMYIAHLLNHSEENDMVQNPYDNEMLDGVYAELEERCRGVEVYTERENGEESVSLPPTRQDLHSLTLTKQIVHEAGLVDEQFLGRLRGIQRLVREEARKNLRQSPIHTFFS